MTKHTDFGKSLDDLNIISSIWVMANNDENNIITYQGIIHRLQLPQNYDVKRLIRSHGELFRPGVQKEILEEWKSDMLADKRLPSWIRELKDSTEREKIIRQITPDDVFRSQFRTRKYAPRSELNIIDWGLQHIERLRRSRLDSIDARQKSIQLWVIIITSIFNVILTIANIVISSVIK